MQHHLTLPLSHEEAAKLHAGDSVLLTGTIYTARDAAHERLTQMLARNETLPFDPICAAIYYVGPSPAPSDMPLGSAGPTTSSRCDPYTPALAEQGVTVLIGKGKRSSEVREALCRHGAVYLAAVGGAGALLARCIRSAEVIAFEDLGTEAVRKLTVKNFPAVVIYDCHGGDWYATARQAYLDSLET